MVPRKPRRKRRWWGRRDLAASSSMPQAKSICSTSCFSLPVSTGWVGIDMSCLISEGIPASDVLGYRAKWLATPSVRRPIFRPCRCRRTLVWHDAGRRFGAERDDHASRLLLKTGGRARIERLAVLTAFSARQFQRRFRTEVGLSPKHYARTIRFDAALVAHLCRAAAPLDRYSPPGRLFRSGAFHPGVPRAGWRPAKSFHRRLE